MKLNYNITNNGYQQPSAVEIYHQKMNALIESGKHPYSRKWSKSFGPGSTLCFDGLDLIHEYKQSDNYTYYFFEAKDVAALVHHHFGRKRGADEDRITTGYIEVWQTARTATAGANLVSLLESKLKPSVEVKQDDRVPVGFWHNTINGPDRDVRLIAYEPWDEVAQNYPGGARARLHQLIKTTPETVSGKIALFYGPAGTGKTTFLRTLAHEWREWADLEYIIDPEIFLNDPGYITEVMLGEDDTRYRVLLLEDSGELVKSDAKITSGQALSRLLNMTDGLLGAGRNVIVAITTNDDISVLHPAVVRPGRCMVKAELGLFPAQEGREWLQRWNVNSTCAEPKTLAELFYLRGRFAADTHEEQAGSGEGEATPARVLGSSDLRPAVAPARGEPGDAAPHL